MVSSVIVITGLCCLLALVYTTRFSAITFHNNTYTDLRQLNLSSGVGEKLASTLHKKHQFISERIRRTNHKSNADLLARVIIKESAIAGYDPFLVTSIIFSESTFRPKVVSHKGAIGLMQLLPTTAEYIAKKEGVAWRGTGSLYEAEYNVRLGIRYIQYLENMFNGDTRKALMAYNWGPGNVRKSLRKKSAVIPQVQQYANKILSRKQQMQNVYFNSNRA